MSGAESLAIPLSGLQLIEASAGTGKTHLIVNLYLRALAVLALPVESVLLLSYTVAATAELRLRVQRRLLQAAEAASGRIGADPELAAILAEAGTARAEAPAALAARLARAARRLDRARIQTIHGWARQVAADEALALGLPLAARFVEDEDELLARVLADARRAALTDPTATAPPPATAPTPSQLARLGAPGEQALVAADAEAEETLLAAARERLLERRERSARYGVDEVLARLADRLGGLAGLPLARRLGDRHPVVLIDEFQDADARQTAIFRRLHAAGGGALILVGDPKQAIYGFRGGDLDNYLAVRAEATRHRLQRNWRARPALLTGLNLLYGAAGSRAFDAGTPPSGIRYRPLLPAGTIDDAALQLERPALLPAALCFAHLPGLQSHGDRAHGEALVARHAAQLVADWRAAAAAGELGRADGQPPGIAVLAENHDQLERLAEALAALGVPLRRRRPRERGRAAAADLLVLWLSALQQPEPARRRTLWASPLYGLPQAALDAAEADPARHAELAEARRRLRREGLPTLLAARLRQAPTLGTALARALQRQVEALVRRVDPRDAAALLDALLDTADAGAVGDEDEPATAGTVSLLTVHAAKGLEFDLVLLPYAGARGRAGSGDAGEQRRAREERLRTLYVALTRARLGVVVGLDLLGSRNDLPALYHLLGADLPGAAPARVARLTLEALADGPSLGLMVWPPLRSDAVGPAPAAGAPIPVPTVPAPRRPPGPAPRLASYSSLLPRPDPAEPDVASEVDAEPELAGARFGSAVHAVLEHADFAAWAGAGPLPAAESARLDAILGRLPDLDPPADRRAAVEAQVRAALNTPLPEGLRLCTLPARERRAELPFTLRLKDPQHGAAALARLAHSLRPSGIAGTALQPPTLPTGWLTGIIDLVYRHAGRWYVLDWKTNRLRAEHQTEPDGLARAAAESGYELQMLLYAVALDRWLAARLPDYRRETHFGGLRWMYLRALDTDGRGIHAPAVPMTLLDQAAALIGPA